MVPTAVGEDAATVSLSARRHRWLLRWWAGFGGTPQPDEPTRPVITGPDGVAMRPGDPELTAALEEEAGFPVAFRSDPERHPDFSGLVHLTVEATRQGLENELRTEVDIRRFRPNLHLETDMSAYEERTWIGKTIMFSGGFSMEIVSPTERCAIPTNDPVTGERSPELLRRLRHNHDLFFGLYGRVVNPATIETGTDFGLS